MTEFDGKLALVMGASGGIGAAVATAFAAQGAHVALHYNRGEAAAQAVADAIIANGGTAMVIQGDVAERGVPAKVVRQAAEGLGGLDILFNNAGAMIRRMPFMELDDALYEEALDLNARPVIAASQAAVPYMEKRGGGSIINVGSIAGIDGGGSGSGHYGSAKAYVHNLTRHMARDLARLNIRVNAIAPGVVQTAFHAATPPERMQAMQATIPLGRLGTPDDCVGPVLFLASSASSYMTGQILHVNGGMYLP
ncbi:SDR family NAD(P)-dependent oxidoreductase [Pelagibacterium lacus]|uniref:SDR family NAD(P)-dependent oxidoreductase n=1 Tax=Pelagibacterium lacus TaxID=2282655 RepID=A0A369W3H0_9HYPH|nr:glucose 1-dehydrogenase [Pelagibacterium lacus]RDE07822.1 SDR family NAD(P)-dependent oxidoreductase [Pelagibacterium lacus]